MKYSLKEIKIILASQSKVRKEILDKNNINCVVEKSNVDEDSVKSSLIKVNASPRHVPSKIIPILDIPKTKNGKLVELAVKQTIEGIKIKNLEALANPDSLEQFKNINELNE